MRRGVLAAALLVAGCRGGDETAADRGSAGDRLERAAIAAHLVADPAARSLDGAWALDSDRACVVPAEGGGERVGLLVDYGEGQGCVARGTLRRRHGDAVDLSLGSDCRIAARFDGGRLTLPATVSAACDRLCTGRASLAAMTVEQRSDSVSEARTVATPSGRPLCP